MSVGLLLGFGRVVWIFVRQVQVDAVEAFSPIALVFNFIVLLGFLQRQRWAWTVARVLCMVAIVAQVLGLFLSMCISPLAALVQVFSGGIVVILTFAMYQALGKPSVRGYFRLTHRT